MIAAVSHKTSAVKYALCFGTSIIYGVSILYVKHMHIAVTQIKHLWRFKCMTVPNYSSYLKLKIFALVHWKTRQLEFTHPVYSPVWLCGQRILAGIYACMFYAIMGCHGQIP